jgi:hypothetical protein
MRTLDQARRLASGRGRLSALQLALERRSGIAKGGAVDTLRMRRRTLVAYSALPMVRAGRQVELAALPVLARVAVLAEAAGSLAAMARRQAERGHVDPRQVALLVTDPADAMAVLGRGRWLPTMQRRVLAAPLRLETVGSKRQRRPMRGQLPLFETRRTARR